MNTEHEINDSLRGEFGTNPSGQQYWRVSWSNKQVEFRKRTYEEHYHGIYLRTITAIEECPKYPLIKERWIIERWIAPDPIYTDEIVSAKEAGSYECIYVFQDKDRNYLPLNLTVAVIVIKSLLSPGTIGRRTDPSETAQIQHEQKEEDTIYEQVMIEYEQLAKKDMKYPDGTRANLNLN